MLCLVFYLAILVADETITSLESDVRQQRSDTGDARTFLLRRAVSRACSADTCAVDWQLVELAAR